VLSAFFGPGSCRRLDWVMRGLAALIVLRVGLFGYSALAGQPAALFRPVAAVAFFDRMPPSWFFVLLQVVGVVAGLAAVVPAVRGRRRWAAFVVAWAAYLVLAGLRSSLGKILHNDVLLLLAAVPFLFPVDDEDDADCGWPVRTSMTVVAGAYFIAGVAKLRHSGIDWVLGDNMRYVLAWGAVDGRSHFDSLASWVSERAWLSTLSAASILALEVGAPVAVGWRPLRPLFAVSAAALHVATWFLLGLDYWAWIGVVAVVLIDWPALAAGKGGGQTGPPWTRGPRRPST